MTNHRPNTGAGSSLARSGKACYLMRSAAEKATEKITCHHREVAPDWSWIDAAYCISLTSRPDRRQEAARQFAAVGLGNQVEFHLVDKHPVDCERGIYESHLTCMERGLARGARRILIFEDDVVFACCPPLLVRRIGEFLASGTPWEVLFLGCMVKASRRTEHPSVLRVRYRSLTHAYVVEAAFAARMLREHAWNGKPYDDFLRDLNSPRMFAVYPSIAFQSNAASDNDAYLRLDRWRRLMGGLRNLQMLDEWYHLHRARILWVHLTAFTLITFWLLRG